MSRRLTGLLIVLATSLLGIPTAQALDWTRADALFAQRLNNRAGIAEARRLYTDLLAQSTTQADKLRAVGQLGRLAIYEGEMLLPKTARDERRAIFAQCWCARPRVSGLPPQGTCQEPGFVDAISPAKLGATHPAYYFFHGACLGYWSEQASLTERLAFSGAIKSDIESGLTTDTRFEGGGIKRMQAGVQSNPATKPLGFYKPQVALAAAGDAINSTPFPGDAFGGAQYYENWHFKAAVLLQLNEDEPNGPWKAQATELVTDKLTEMDEKIADDDLPSGREPEFQYSYRTLKEQYKTLTGQDWP